MASAMPESKCKTASGAVHWQHIVNDLSQFDQVNQQPIGGKYLNYNTELELPRFIFRNQKFGTLKLLEIAEISGNAVATWYVGVPDNACNFDVT